MTSIHPFVFFLFVISLSVRSDTFTCSRGTEDYRCTFTTMTPYRFIANDGEDSEIVIPDCEAKKIWLMIRHGTRYPSKMILSKVNQLPIIQRAILNNCKTVGCPLSDSQRESLEDWNLTYCMDDQMILITEGEDELIALGERFQSRFPNLMPKIYSNDTYKFKFAADQRTQESFKHFAIGLFGKYHSNKVWYPEAETEDRILLFYKACDKWQRDINKNAEAHAEVEKLKKSTMMTEMLTNLSHRFNYTFDFDTAELIHRMCATETSSNKTYTSPWCHFLTLEEMKIMEFVDDLDYYWIEGYGYELTYKHACIALVDTFNFFNSNDDIKVSAYFVHSKTILKVLSLLGIAKDEYRLFHDNYNTSKDRLWRTSLIGASASNIALVLYDCKSTGPSILTMHQERIVQLPGCPSGIPCPISTMRNNYPDEEKECNFNDMCSIDT